jgi:uncharacterized protein (TIGR03435 family)
MKNPIVLSMSCNRRAALAAAAGSAALVATIAVGIVSAPFTRAQSNRPPVRAAPDSSIQFEVASVKPSPPPGPDGSRLVGCKGGPGSTGPGLFTCANIDISYVVTMAFNLRSYQFPAREYADTAMYEISAKVPPGTTRERFDYMLQNLLIERFKLAYHYEKKEMAVLDLVVGKSGVKMKGSPPEAGAYRRPNIG